MSKAEIKQKDREIKILKDRIATLVRQRETLASVLKDVQAHLGQCVHAAFRNAPDHPNAFLIWSWIGDIPDNIWAKILSSILGNLGVTKAIEDMEKVTKKESTLNGTEVPQPTEEK